MCFRPTSSFWFHLNSKSYTPPPLFILCHHFSDQ